MTGSPVWRKDDEGMAVCIMCVLYVVSTASSKVLRLARTPTSFINAPPQCGHDTLLPHIVHKCCQHSKYALCLHQHLTPRPRLLLVRL
ncbi:hypothetical protein M405DRAFT_811539 [Rhizopogon salebrosus TDB-379]|nr:hypothetical protein M405DRAFT_811539 [Rhizopogon salebrosus TDB-379]